MTRAYPVAELLASTRQWIKPWHRILERDRLLVLTVQLWAILVHLIHPSGRIGPAGSVVYGVLLQGS